MIKLNYLLGVLIITSTLLFSNCNNSSKNKEQVNTSEYNILASVKNPAGFFSINLMDLLAKSNIRESKEMPLQFKMIVNSQIEQHFNSELQGFELEGNIPFVISTSDDSKFNYLMSTTNVLDAKKIGVALSGYFSGKLDQKGDVSTFEISVPGAFLKGTFAWDKEKMVVVLTENGDATALSKELLANKTTDAEENERVKAFLAGKNDFSSLFYMDVYTQMVNQLSNTKLDEELMAAYKGMVVHATANFNTGNFKFETKLEAENFVNSKFNTVNATPIDADYDNFITENGKLIAYSAASLNLDALVHILKHTEDGYNEYGDEFTNFGIKAEEINTLLDGQFSFSVMDLESIPTEGYEDNVAFNQERPKFLFAGGLKDVEKVKVLLNNNANIKVVNNYYLADDFYIGIAGQKLVVSLNEDLIQKLANGQTLPPFKTNYTTPLSGIVMTDMNQLPDSFKAILLSNGGEEVLKIFNLLDEVKFTGDINNTEFKIVLTDQSTNSFELITNSILKNLLPLVMGGML